VHLHYWQLRFWKVDDSFLTSSNCCCSRITCSSQDALVALTTSFCRCTSSPASVCNRSISSRCPLSTSSVCLENSDNVATDSLDAKPAVCRGHCTLAKRAKNRSTQRSKGRVPIGVFSDLVAPARCFLRPVARPTTGSPKSFCF